MKSWKCEMLCQGSWCSNGQRFPSKESAEAAGNELMTRWFVPTDRRAVESDDPINCKFDFAHNAVIWLDR